MSRHLTSGPKPGSKVINLVGETFGLLTVVEYTDVDKYKNKRWLCKCSCGNDVFVTTTRLRTGQTTSCGCNHYKKGKDIYNYSGYEDITGTKWNSITNNAKVRNLNFDVTKEEVWKLYINQKELCALSGREISFKEGTASVDRVDSNKGYSLDNIQILHKDVNLMKNAFDEEYFIEICKQIANYR